MESVSEFKPSEPSVERERSTIEFPYSDLDAAVEVVRGIYHAGGTACEMDQLAAQLKMEAKGGGFRLRVSGAKCFGLVSYDRNSRVYLTDLGRQMLDAPTERAARAAAFLTVPLYVKVYEQFKGGPLPPQAGLERAIETLGVGSKVRDKARQVLLRSAKQSGFFDAAPDRLVKPSIRSESFGEPAPSHDRDSESVAAASTRSSAGLPGNSFGGDGGGGGGGGRDHPLIQGLLLTLPAPGSDWKPQERVNWLTMASSIFTMIYKDGGEQAAITINSGIRNGGSNSAL